MGTEKPRPVPPLTLYWPCRLGRSRASGSWKGCREVKERLFLTHPPLAVVSQAAASSPSAQVVRVLRAFPHGPRGCKEQPVRMSGSTSWARGTWRVQPLCPGRLHTSGWFWARAVPSRACVWCGSDFFSPQDTGMWLPEWGHEVLTSSEVGMVLIVI